MLPWSHLSFRCRYLSRCVPGRARACCRRGGAAKLAAGCDYWQPSGAAPQMIAQLELSYGFLTQIIIAFLCANALVLVMYIYRVVRKPGDDREETSSSSGKDGMCFLDSYFRSLLMAAHLGAPEVTDTAARNEAPVGSASTGQFTSIISPLTSIYTGDHGHSFGHPGQSQSSSAPAFRIHGAESSAESRLRSMSQFPTLSSRS